VILKHIRATLVFSRGTFALEVSYRAYFDRWYVAIFICAELKNEDRVLLLRVTGFVVGLLVGGVEILEDRTRSSCTAASPKLNWCPNCYLMTAP